ncbi:MAG TPA: peptidylprolyl isomerase, partial [Pyrinomonadaceae bacterium]|nr:peptidylprolyl isomerase [Pyrinomonadaceae bacterium]
MPMRYHLNEFRRATRPLGRVAALASLSVLLSFSTPFGEAQKKTASKQTGATARSVVPAETLLRIVRAEDERRWEAADLGALFEDRSAAVRRRAALAAGRIGDEGAIAPLSALLRKERDEGVRAMVAFALGEIESDGGADVLLETFRLAKGPELRARIVEALGKIAAALPEAKAERKRALGDVIIAALEAERKLARPNRALVLEGLTAALRVRPANGAKTVALFLSSTDARARADAANALARMRAKESLDVLRALLANDKDAVVRANAARALGVAEDAAAFDVLLAHATTDTDSRVRVSALRSLATLKDARAAQPLILRAAEVFAAYKAAKTGAAVQPSEVNELLEIATTLGRVATNANQERAIEMLRQFRQGGLDAPEVEIALARIAPVQYLRDKALTDLSARASGGASTVTWQRVSAIGQGLGEIANITSAMGGNSFVSLQADAQIFLRGLVSDRSTPALAVPDLLRSLAAFKPADLAPVMRAQLGAQDVIVRATAADALGEMDADAQNARALIEALPRALTDEMNDAALSILGALAKQKSPEANAAIKSALEVPDYLVRRRAADLLKANAGGGGESVVETVATRNRAADYQRALGRVGKRVRAIVSTDKGAFTIDLLPDDAPLTVDNFVQLARRNYFNGITFHRVVPNFVVQGGDPRGDGNGGPGYQIRCEINTVEYGRGAVGMALSGKDTGGSQWFVTHSPQPHLDGGYTVFGRVTEGLDVIDRIARGDRILSVA